MKVNFNKSTKIIPLKDVDFGQCYKCYRSPNSTEIYLKCKAEGKVFGIHLESGIGYEIQEHYSGEVELVEAEVTITRKGIAHEI